MGLARWLRPRTNDHAAHRGHGSRHRSADRLGRRRLRRGSDELPEVPLDPGGHPRRRPGGAQDRSLLPALPSLLVDRRRAGRGLRPRSDRSALGAGDRGHVGFEAGEDLVDHPAPGHRLGAGVGARPELAQGACARPSPSSAGRTRAPPRSRYPASTAPAGSYTRAPIVAAVKCAGCSRSRASSTAKIGQRPCRWRPR